MLLKTSKKAVSVSFLILLKTICYCQESDVKFIAELPVPSEFTLFANGGWNGNWYVGYNHGWISNVGKVHTAGYTKVYLGARLGRAKSSDQIKKILQERNPEKKNEINPGPFKINIGVSSSKEKKPEKSFLLAATDRIPLEGSAVMALDGVGESEWFWVGIPPSLVSSDSDNFIHIWSDDPELSGADVAPILAAGEGSNSKENSFLVTEDAIKVIKFFEPALAVKMVGSISESPSVEIVEFTSHPVDPMKQIVKTEVKGNYITGVEIELNDGTEWRSVGKRVKQPPYDMIFSFKNLKPGKYKLRCRVKNWYEAEDYSMPKTFTIEEE